MHAQKYFKYQVDINKDRAQARAEVKLNNLHLFIHSQHIITKAEGKMAHFRSMYLHVPLLCMPTVSRQITIMKQQNMINKFKVSQKTKSKKNICLHTVEEHLFTRMMKSSAEV